MNRPRALWDRAINFIAAIGGPVEDPDLRTEKTVLVALSISAIPLGIIWTLVELSTGDYSSAYASALTAALILANFLLYLSSEPGRIQISETTHKLLNDEFDCERRGEIQVKGMGRVKTWFLLGSSSD